MAPSSTGGPSAPVNGVDPQKVTMPPLFAGQKKLAPISKPLGIDEMTLLQERENRISARIGLRMKELEALNLDDFDQDTRMKAEIELRALKLLNFQKALRAEVVHGMKRDCTVETMLNLKLYKRAKKQTLKEARLDLSTMGMKCRIFWISFLLTIRVTFDWASYTLGPPLV